MLGTGSRVRSVGMQPPDRLYRAFRAAALLRTRGLEAAALGLLEDSVGIVMKIMKRICSGE